MARISSVAMMGGRPRSQTTNPIARAVKIGLIAFAIVVVALAVVAWLGGEQELLPFEYEGFD